MDTPVILAFVSAFVAGALALAIVFLERRSPARWFFVAGLAVLAVESIFSALAAGAVLPERVVRWQAWKLCAFSFLPETWLLFSLSYARGNARQSLVKWRFLLAAAGLAPVGLALLFREDLIVSVGQVAPTYQWLLRLGTPGVVLNHLVLLSVVLVLMNLERTFRASVGTMRWRIKFTLLGLGLLFAVRAYTSSQVLVFRAIDPSLQPIDSMALLVACLVMARSLLRTGHFEVNVYPSRALLHNSFTLLVAGVYLALVGVLAKVVEFLGGDATFHLKAFLVLVSLVLLAVLLLSDRVRLQTRRLVSRHFHRPLYDYRSVWRTFTEGTARRVEQTDLCEAVVKLVSDIFQALSVTLWLVDEKKEKFLFAASTAFSRATAGHLDLDVPDAAQVIAALRGHPNPVDLDSAKEIWAAALRRANPAQFRNGANRVGVPLIAGDELLGVMALGDRVGGVPFSLQDFDLLKAVSDQSAASLLNFRLSQRLSQAKQLEAFQAMSAFFVHDLKNTASTLSLTLQNLPTHYQDSAFREDALRGISKTVTHINELIGRLSLFRQELSVQSVECDLNELVSEALKDHAGKPGVEIVKELRPLPKVGLDPDQIRKVLTNLLFNAQEAVGTASQIRVETSQANGWIVLAVADNGCGMTPEFVQARLFRPFQTTKKHGIGIGLFHCKMIVEAHRGRIEVQSQPGKGTAFRVLLPLNQ